MEETRRSTTVRDSVRAAAGMAGTLLVGKGQSDSIRHRLLAGLAGLLSLRVAFGAIAFASNVLLARLLGMRGVGSYSYALAWVTLLGAPAILGLDQLIVREVPAYRLRGDWSLLRGLVRSANWIVLATSGLLIAITIAVSWLLRSRTVPETISALWVSMILVPLIALTRLRLAALQGLHRVVRGSIPERLVLPGILLLCLVATWAAGARLTPSLAMWYHVGATIIAFALGARILRAHFPADARAAVPEYRIRQWIRGGVPIFLLTSVGVVFNQADILILGFFRGPGPVGLYGVADKTADLLTVVLLAQSAAFASTAASLHAEKNYETLQRLTTRLARLTLFATLPLCLFFIFFGRLFLTFFYGAPFAGATTALTLLSIGQLVNVAAGLNGLLLVMLDQTQAGVKVVGTAAAVNVVLNFALVPHWGMEGAALGNMISLIVWNVLATAALQRATGVHTTVFARSHARAPVDESPRNA